jgi:hypothetical protein
VIANQMRQFFVQSNGSAHHNGSTYLKILKAINNSDSN